MEVLIIKYDYPNEVSRKSYPILKCKPIHSSQSLLIIKGGQMGVDEGKELPYYEINKVQYLAYCDVELAGNLLVAFYLDEYAGISAAIIDELPNNYHQEGDQSFLIDYKSYREICEMTDETSLPLAQYILSVKGGNLGPNSFLEVDGKLLNHDQQINKWSVDECTNL
jgi:hypothetical protein